MRIREPIVAGRFYPQDGTECRTELQRLLSQAPACRESEVVPIAGLLPHAGWSYSGQVAARVFSHLSTRPAPDVVVLFGGVHRSRGKEAAMFSSGRWETPVGSVAIDDRLSDRILSQTNLIVDDSYAHEDEHSIEVQLPFVRHLFPSAKMIPIMVPPGAHAHEVGEAVARTLTVYRYNAVVVGTTDLTHYGPSYGFTPRGAEAKGRRWAKEENDRRFLDRVCALQASELVAEAARHKNACSSGAAAATVAAAVALGATRAAVLEHTTSAEVFPSAEAAAPKDSVGYAGIVFA